MPSFDALAPIGSVVVFVVSVIFIYYLYYQHCFTYWKKRGIPEQRPIFPTGNLGWSAVGKESVYVRLQTLYHKFKDAGHKYGGIYFFNGPLFFPVDPDLIKRILLTDFNHFVDRGIYSDEKSPMSVHIFSHRGNDWRNIRIKYTPTFTSGKMKLMYQILVKNFANLVNTLEPIAKQELVIDIKSFLVRVTSDIIGTAAFGVEIDTLKNPDSEFAKMVAKLFNCPRRTLLKLAIQDGLQNPGNLIKIPTEVKELRTYFGRLVEETIAYRDQNDIARNDFLNMLMQLRSTGMTLEHIMAESYLFFAAGFESSSSTISSCIYELAKNQNIQSRLRQEIHDTLGKDSSNYTYEGILSLPYLDMVVKETLRKYPIVGMLNRICVKPYQIPGTETIIDKDTLVVIPLLGLQRDPDYFPDPLCFDPERFSSDRTVVPFTFLPFGDGPRNCLGLRFGMMQVKLGLATMLNNFRFYPSENSPQELEINPATTSLFMSILGGIHTKIVKI